MTRVVLKILTGPNEGLEQTFEEEVIGLSRLPFGRPPPAVEPARISLVGGRATLVDLGAPQGVLVNGQRVTSAELKVGDRIELGPGGPAVQVVALEAPRPETRPCPACGRPIKVTAIKCAHCRTFVRAAGTGSPADGRDLLTEAHLLAIGMWWRVFAMAGILGAAALLISGQGPAGAPPLLVRGLGVLCAAGFGVGYAVGWGLSRFQSWARITAIVLSLLAAAGCSLMLLVGAALAGLHGGFPALLLQVFVNLVVGVTLLKQPSARVCSEEYQRLIEQTPELRADVFRSGFFWVYAAVFALMVSMILLTIGGRG